MPCPFEGGLGSRARVRAPAAGLALAAVLSAPGAGAQTIGVLGTLPRGYANDEGPGGTDLGWVKLPARLATFFPPYLVPQTFKTVKGLRVRPDWLPIYTFHSRSLTIEAALSDRGVPYHPPFVRQWAGNLGTNRTVVMRKRSVSLPAGPRPPGKWPLPWSKSVDLPFDRPWTRSGSAADAVCVDLKFYSSTTPVKPWFADADSLLNTGSFRWVTGGCPNLFAFTVFDPTYVGAPTPAESVGIMATASGEYAICYVGLEVKRVRIPGSSCTIDTQAVVWHPQVQRFRSNLVHFVWGPITKAWAGARFINQILAISKSWSFQVLGAADVRIGPGLGSRDQVTLYGYGSNYDPDRSPPMNWTRTVTIFGFY